MSKIRRATLKDIDGLAAVVQAVWGEALDFGLCRAHLKSDTTTVWVAAADKKIVGFVSAFLTRGQHNVRRWEVDLLAVRPASRGRQIGQKLVEATWQDARQRQVNLARAVVRIDNIASQRTFERAGYLTDGQVYKLFLWSPEAGDGVNTYLKNVTLVPVDTLTYRGLWIEGLAGGGVSADEQRQAVKTAQILLAQQGRLTTGALIAAADEVHLAADLRATAILHGEFHWWQKSGTFI
ncbi:MAG: GNAT family N-acetyltransferase [Anaerolineae bacterium]|nr:GNAT family N-acetyltransferase [Anaerolineae bacterium]